MKVYLHWEGDFEFTKVLTLSTDLTNTVLDVLVQFCDALHDTIGVDTEPHQCVIRTSNKRILQHSTPVKKAFKDRNDYYISASSVGQRSQQQQGVTDAAAQHSTAAQHDQSIAEHLAAVDLSTDDEHQHKTDEVAHQRAATTDDAAARSASNHHNGDSSTAQHGATTLSQLSVLTSGAAQQIVQQAGVYEDKGSYRAALQLYRQGLEKFPGDNALTECMVRLLLRVQRAEEALAMAQHVAARDPENIPWLQLVAECQMQAGQLQQALASYESLLQHAIEEGNEAAQHDMKVAMATVLYRMKDDTCVQYAIAMVTDVLRSTEQNHSAALLLYARLAIDKRVWSDAVQVLLRLIVQQPNSAEVKSLLAAAAKDEEGMSSMLQAVPAQHGHEAALAFLATSIKEHGAVHAAASLYRLACDLQPFVATYALNYMHTLELAHRYHDACIAARTFCVAAKDKIQLGGGVDMFAIATCHLADLPPLPPWSDCGWYAAECSDPSTTAQHDSVLATVPQVRDRDKVEYSDDTLDALAVLQTIVKIVFIGGALTRTRAIAEALQPAVDASAVELHRTLIRNEAAYFSCIRKLLEEYPIPPQKQSKPYKPLYVMGDSHCLSPAWRTVTLRGEKRTLVPVLCTGTKIWHLRPDSTFYTKHQFEAAVAALPRGAQIIMTFGEIDCREGLLLAVDKLKYDSVMEGIEATLDIYIALLLRLIESRDFELFVHPIPPVLKECRAIVVPFAAVLREKVMAAASRHTPQRLHMLDFFQSLLSEDGTHLRDGLELDGTHLSPNYLSVLQSSLNTVA